MIESPFYSTEPTCRQNTPFAIRVPRSHGTQQDGVDATNRLALRVYTMVGMTDLYSSEYRVPSPTFTELYREVGFGARGTFFTIGVTDILLFQLIGFRVPPSPI